MNCTNFGILIVCSCGVVVADDGFLKRASLLIGKQCSVMCFVLSTVALYVHGIGNNGFVPVIIIAIIIATETRGKFVVWPLRRQLIKALIECFHKSGEIEIGLPLLQSLLISFKRIKSYGDNAHQYARCNYCGTDTVVTYIIVLMI